LKNIIDEKPTDPLSGRALFTTKFVSNLDIKGKRLLDVGCGYGWFELNALKRNCKRIVGIEVSDSDLETARKHIKNKKVFFRVGSAIDLPFKSNSFDTVVSWEVIEHIPKNMEKKMFQEIYRVLKHGGVFYLSTPNNNFLSNMFDPAWWLIGHRHYSKEQILNLSKKYFSLSKFTTRGKWWDIVSILNLYISKWVFRRKPFLKDFINKLNNRDYKTKGYVGLYVKLKKK